MTVIHYSVTDVTVCDIWLRGLAPNAELYVRKNGAVVEAVTAECTEEALCAHVRVDESGDYSFEWDGDQVSVELAYAYRPEHVLDEGITQLVVSSENERPQYVPLYHFTPPWGWINDPNGMCVFGDRIHMFYQHMPLLRRRKRTMIYWGHATSRDGLNWTHLPIFLGPREELLRDPTKGGGAYSGSVIPMPDQNGLRVFYTDREDDRLPEREWQQVAVSRDLISAGPSETIIRERPNVPNLGNDFRDPYVFKGPDGLWKMTLGARNDIGGVVLLYETTDPTAAGGWTFVQPIYQIIDHGLGAAECPCILPLNEDGLWVLVLGLITRSEAPRHRDISLAIVGKFDGREFQPLHTQEFDYGTDAYAFQGWLDADGPLGIAWAANWAEISREVDYFSGYTLARRLEWRGDHLATPPAYSTESLRTRLLADCVSPATIALNDGAAELVVEMSQSVGPVRIEIDVPGEHIAFEVGNAEMHLEYGMGGDASTYMAKGRPSTLRVFVDIGIVEIYADDGRWCFTKRIATWLPARTVRIDAVGASMKVWSIKKTTAANEPSATNGQVLENCDV